MLLIIASVDIPNLINKIQFYTLVLSFITPIIIYKRIAYMLTANCYGSKSVTQPDAFLKRYLWDKC